MNFLYRYANCIDPPETIHLIIFLNIDVLSVVASSSVKCFPITFLNTDVLSVAATAELRVTIVMATVN